MMKKYINQDRWSTIKTGSKKYYDKAYVAVDKLGAPVNKLTNKIGSEAFWPTSLDKECDKAARILRSFARDGFIEEETTTTTTVQTNPSTSTSTSTGPTIKQKVLKKIPPEVIANAQGLAIFTVMRTGLWFSGAGGSGIIIARTESGEWSPPSGILLHTAGLGFLVGVDIYDCVVVLNTKEAVNAFTSARFTLGGEMSAAAGPLGMGGVLDSNLKDVKKRPVWSYLKSRGFYAGVQIDGTVVIERGDENATFYGERVKVKDILAGNVRRKNEEQTKMLMSTVRMAEGKRVNSVDLPRGEAPGELDVQPPPHLPSETDEDPYGLEALKAQGIDVHAAGQMSSADTVYGLQANADSHLYEKHSSTNGGATM